MVKHREKQTTQCGSVTSVISVVFHISYATFSLIFLGNILIYFWVKS